MKWFRFYSEFMDDPKIAMMSDSDQLLWVKCLCLASESSVRGFIVLTDEQICWKLRITAEIWRHAVDKFQAQNMIERGENGYQLINWDKRQFASDSSNERVSKHREKKKRRCNVTSNKSVSPSEQIQNTDSKTDTDKKKKILEADPNSALAGSMPIELLTDQQPSTIEENIFSFLGEEGEEESLSSGLAAKDLAPDQDQDQDPSKTEPDIGDDFALSGAKQDTQATAETSEDIESHNLESIASRSTEQPYTGKTETACTQPIKRTSSSPINLPSTRESESETGRTDQFRRDVSSDTKNNSTKRFEQNFQARTETGKALPFVQEQMMAMGLGAWCKGPRPLDIDRNLRVGVRKHLMGLNLPCEDGDIARFVYNRCQGHYNRSEQADEKLKDLYKKGFAILNPEHPAVTETDIQRYKRELALSVARVAQIEASSEPGFAKKILIDQQTNLQKFYNERISVNVH